MVLRRVTHQFDQDMSRYQQQILPSPKPVTSYWLNEPHKYANLRSTPSLPEACDIAIIGSGMAGVLTAYHICKESNQKLLSKVPKVVLLEARQLCAGATGRNGGHSKTKTATLAGLGSVEARNEFQSFVLGVIDELKNLVDDEDLDCEFELRRSFDVFLDAEEVERVHEIYDAGKKSKEPWTQHISYIDARSVSQVTSIRDAKGAFSVPCASFWPYKLVTGLLERIIQKWPENINIQTNTPVTALSSAGTNGSTILTTHRGTLTTRKLVLATNAYTAGLVPSFTGSIVPVRGMAAHITPFRPIHPHLNNTYNIAFAPTSSGPTGVDYLNPRPDGGIVVGGQKWQFDANRAAWYDNFDDSARFSERVERCWDGYMQGTFLGWEASGAERRSVWVGVMGSTGDGLPFVGRVPVDGKGNREKEKEKVRQWVLAGFNGGGMSFIPTVAKAVARMVLENKGFDEVKEEFGLLDGFATSVERLVAAGRK